MELGEDVIAHLLWDKGLSAVINAAEDSKFVVGGGVSEEICAKQVNRLIPKKRAKVYPSMFE